jgi:hypothetical protein
MSFNFDSYKLNPSQNLTNNIMQSNYLKERTLPAT